MHSHCLKKTQGLEDMRAANVGIGNSAVDAAGKFNSVT